MPCTSLRICRRVAISTLSLALVLLLPGCKKMQRTDTRPLDQAGMWFQSIEELKKLNVTNAEVGELAKVRQAGLSDSACVELMRITRGRSQAFASGDAIAGLRQVGVSENTILELVRLNQLGLWVGEAQAVRLVGFSDQVLLAMARRRAAGQPVLSGASLAQLKNAGMGESEILKLIERGATDEQAAALVAAHRRAITPSGFVRQPRRRRR